MREVRNPSTWRDQVSDAPLSADPEVIDKLRSKPDAHPDDALDVCGVRVKGGFNYQRKCYQLFGKLIKLEGDEVIVASTLDQETLWFGSVDEYHQMWSVD